MADPIGLLKDVAQVVKKFNDLELMKQVVDLQMAVFEQEQEKLRLSKELAAAKEQLDIKNKLKLKQFGDVHYYVIEGEGIAYCPTCYGTKTHLIPLPAGEPWSGGFRRICPACKTFFYEKPMVSERQVIPSRGGPLFPSGTRK